MGNPLYVSTKGLAYSVLATIASCDHNKATSQGYADGWQMLMDKHDGNEMALFCQALPTVLTEPQRQVLLDGLAREYGHCADWAEFVHLSCEHMDWLPSRGGRPQ